SFDCRRLLGFMLCFFFQAEDGIRDRNVTGVQTCALPIYIKISHNVVSSFHLNNYLLPFLIEVVSFTKPFLGPGTFPFTRTTLFSASTLTISKFCIVTVFAPIRPGNPLPLNTLEASEAIPIEPGLLWK